MSKEQLYIGLISDSEACEFPGIRPEAVLAIPSQTLEPEQCACLDYIIIDLLPRDAFNVLHTLRAHPLTRYLALFTLKVLNEHVSALSDGVVKDHEDAQIIAHEQKRLQEAFTLVKDETDSDAALLQFLYTRPNKILLPLQNLSNKALYEYPLLRCFTPNALMPNPLDWINHLVEQGFLNRVTLIDRLHCCPNCHSARLKFLDRCPLCQSIDVNEARFFHCFTCGHVNTEDQFIQYDSLRCPRCQTILRHIGSDYDRPIENFHCKKCSENFIEPEISADCLDCRNPFPPEKLKSISIYSVTISKRGRHAVLNETITEISSIFNGLNYVTPEHFKFTLNWFLRLCKRSPEIHFSLMHIQLTDLDDLLSAWGTGKVQLLLQDFSKSLRELIRSTDLSTHSDADSIWLLLPQTPVTGAFVLKGRIENLKEKFEIGSEYSLKTQIKFLGRDDCDFENDTAEILLSRLLGSQHNV